MDKEIQIHQKIDSLTLSSSWKDHYKALNLKYNSIAQVIESNRPALVDVIKKNGIGNTKTIISIAIIDVCKFFSVGKSISQDQVLEIAELIMENYSQFSMADIAVCFKMAKTGKLSGGKLYDRLDGNIICLWLNEYDELKREKRSQMERSKPMDELYKDYDDNAANNALQAIKERIAEKKRYISKEVFEAPKSQKKSAEDLMIEKWIKYFNEWHDSKKDSIFQSGIKFIRKNGQVMDLQTFLRYRMSILQEWNARMEY